MRLPMPSNSDSSASNDLPFFTSGLFKPRQLGYHRIKEHVERTRGGLLEGILLIRDGVPLLDLKSKGEVGGQILYFEDINASEKAYEAILDVEPGNQYRWATAEVTAGGDADDVVGESVTVNVLEGRNPQNGTSELVAEMWDGRDDPLFNEALDVVEKTLEEYSGFDWEDTVPFFKVQMAYLLLWSSVERYTSLRHGLKGTKGDLRPFEKRKEMAEEDAFAKGVQTIIPDSRRGHVISRADRPHVYVSLEPDDPGAVLDYYWQVRSNLAHRGKSAPLEFKLLHSSAYELLRIFQDFVLPAAFSSEHTVNSAVE